MKLSFLTIIANILVLLIRRRTNQKSESRIFQSRARFPLNWSPKNLHIPRSCISGTSIPRFFSSRFDRCFFPDFSGHTVATFSGAFYISRSPAQRPVAASALSIKYRGPGDADATGCRAGIPNKGRRTWFYLWFGRQTRCTRTSRYVIPRTAHYACVTEPWTRYWHAFLVFLRVSESCAMLAVGGTGSRLIFHSNRTWTALPLPTVLPRFLSVSSIRFRYSTFSSKRNLAVFVRRSWATVSPRTVFYSIIVVIPFILCTRGRSVSRRVIKL